MLNSKQILAVAKCLSGYVNEAQKHVMVKKTVTKDPFNQRFTPSEEKDVLLNIIKPSRAIVQAPFFLAVRHGNRHKNNNIWYM
jgi:hypothetical protein